MCIGGGGCRCRCVGNTTGYVSHVHTFVHIPCVLAVACVMCACVNLYLRVYSSVRWPTHFNSIYSILLHCAGATVMSRIDLSSNKITFIESFAFADTTFLEFLTLGGNALTQIDEFSFSGLVRPQMPQTADQPSQILSMNEILVLVVCKSICG